MRPGNSQAPVIEPAEKPKERFSPPGGSPPGCCEIDHIRGIIRPDQDVLVAEISMSHLMGVHLANNPSQLIEELACWMVLSKMEGRTLDVLDEVAVPVYDLKEAGDAIDSIEQLVGFDFPPNRPAADETPIEMPGFRVIPQHTFPALPFHQPDIGLRGRVGFVDQANPPYFVIGTRRECTRALERYFA